MKLVKTLAIGFICFSIGFFTSQWFNLSSVTSPEESTKIDSTSLPSNDDNSSRIQSGQIKQNQKSDAIRPDVIQTNDVEIKRLKAQIDSLEKQLASKESGRRGLVTKQKHSQSDSQKVEQNKTIESISRSEAESYLPEPFSNIIAGSSGTIAKDYLRFHEESVDYDWGYNMEMTIKDFVVMHPQSDNLKLDNVTCKSSTCEIRGFEYKPKSWSAVLNEMRQQSWWTFKGSHSSMRSSKNYGDYFFVLISTKA